MDKKIICKLKNECLLYTGNSISDGDKDKFTDKEEAYPYISTKDIDITTNSINYYNDMFIKKSESKFKIAPENSILLCIEGGSAGKKIAITDQPVAFVNKLCCINSKKNTKYYYYYLQCNRFIEDFKLNMSGLIGGVSVSKLKDIKIITYPIEIQNKVVDFLDEQCLKIDKAIEVNKKSIDLLRNYKLSVIDKEVCKQNNIKCHLGLIGDMKNGLNFKSDYSDNKIKFLGVGNITNELTISKESDYSEISYNKILDNEYLLKNGDIVFVRSNGSKELVGRSIMVENVEYPLTYSGFCIRFRNKRKDMLKDKFLLLFFRSSYFRSELERLSRGTNINNLSQELLSQISVDIPTMENQEKIISMVENKIKLLDKTIETKERANEKLEEYKQSLIYEVVTGKKEIK